MPVVCVRLGEVFGRDLRFLIFLRLFLSPLSRKVANNEHCLFCCNNCKMIDLNLSSVFLSLFPFLGSFLYIYLHGGDEEEFLSQITVPWFMPPVSVYPWAWGILHITSGYASYIVYRDFGIQSFHPSLVIYPLHLILQWLYVILAKKGFILVVVAVSCIACDVLTSWAFWDINSVAGMLMIPTMVWMLQEVSCIIYVWRNNEYDTKGNIVAKGEKKKKVK